MRKLFLVAFCSLLIITSTYSHPPQYVFDPDDYLIYSTLIDQWYAYTSIKMVVIRKYTGLRQPVAYLDQELYYLSTDLPILAQETLDDFKAKNIHSYPLGNFLNQRLSYKLISQSEINDLFRYQQAWEKFRQRYPDSDGILTFSRVGFDRYKSQALVYIDNQWGNFSGSGIYAVLFRDKDGSWNIYKEISAWDSWYAWELNPNFRPLERFPWKGMLFEDNQDRIFNEQRQR